MRSHPQNFFTRGERRGPFPRPEYLMPSVLPFGFYQGSRSEYLATYILSRLCVVTPVRREGDFGVDLLCHLARQAGGRLTIGEPFSVQVKSEGEAEILITSSKTPANEMASTAVRWILGRTMPYFIVIASKKEQRVQIYSTVKLSRLHFTQEHPIHAIVLCPGGSANGPKDLVYSAATKTETVYLGHPIIDITGSDVEDDNTRANVLADVLADWVRLDLENILNRKSNIGYTLIYDLYETNQRPNTRGGIATWSIGGPLTPLLERLATVLTAVGFNISETLPGQSNDYARAVELVGALELCEREGTLDEMGIELLERIRGA